jgi:ubiquinone/menaquinone biosynthesis C-methylase UbiE
MLLIVIMLLTDAEVKDAIRCQWDISSKDYDSHEGHGIKSKEERDAWKRILSYAFPGSSLDILDVGCGTGELSLVLAEMGHDVVGIDLSEKMLSCARDKAKYLGLDVDFLVEDAENLKFPDASFDGIISRHVMWTLPHPKAAFEEWKRVLRNGGYLSAIDGEWRDNSFKGRSRRLVSSLAILLAERRNPWKRGYPKEIRSQLAHPDGLRASDALEYLESLGLENVTICDLSRIRELQRATMPFCRRISFNWTYYLVRGIKKA